MGDSAIVSLNVDGVLLPSPLVTAALSPGSISSLSFTSSLHGGEQPGLFLVRSVTLP